MIDFGSPKANDGTAKRERRIIRAAERRNERIKSGANQLNRPIGSKVNAKPEEQLADWEMALSNPAYLDPNVEGSLMFQVMQRAQVVGPFHAADELVDHALKMQKLAGER